MYFYSADKHKEHKVERIEKGAWDERVKWIPFQTSVALPEDL
jgi:hypothetical protein